LYKKEQIKTFFNGILSILQQKLNYLINYFQLLIFTLLLFLDFLQLLPTSNIPNQYFLHFHLE